MPDVFTRGDSLREFLTGALTDDGVQSNPNLSLGGHRSSTEAVSLGIAISSPIPNLFVEYAGGANPIGAGTLTAVDTNNLTWQPFGESNPGAAVHFSGTSVEGIVEAQDAPGEYLRILCTTPFTPGSSTITLSYLTNNFFGFDDVSVANAGSGISEYRATMWVNLSTGTVGGIQRWISLLGTPQTSDGGYLASSGGGTIVTSGTFIDWPSAGWVQIQDSTGTLKEVVYYTSRTNTILTIGSTGRGLLGTSLVAGTLTDIVNPVPGIALGLDPAGTQSLPAGIQTIANSTTSPTGVTWNLGITPSTGLQIGDLLPNQEVGIWMWRQMPPNTVSTPSALIQVSDNFSAF